MNLKKINISLYLSITVLAIVSFVVLGVVNAQVPLDDYVYYNLPGQTLVSSQRFSPRLPNQALSSFPACFKNLSTNSYFIPNRTSPEWDSFMVYLPPGVSQTNCCGDTVCDNGETTANCPDDCGNYDPNCDSSPAGIYTGGIYYVQHGELYDNPAPYPVCGITSENLAGTNPVYTNTQNFLRDDGVGYKHTNCVALFKSTNQICSGDVCFKGISPKYYDGVNSKTLSPDFCYGEYNVETNMCESNYTQNPTLTYGQAVASGYPSINGLEGFTYSQSSSSVLTTKVVKTEATWGSCSNCGDGYCDLTAEEQTFCPADCSSASTCNNNSVCDATEDCFFCQSDCGTCGTEPIYRGVAYYAASGVGDCNLTSPTHTFSESTTLTSGDITRCTSLIKASNINDGDTCITGVQQISQISPSYCVGQYDVQTNKCVYQGNMGPSVGYSSPETLVLKLNSINEAVWGGGSIMNSSDFSVGTWGRCSN